jgi:hypothetical protein
MIYTVKRLFKVKENNSIRSNTPDPYLAAIDLLYEGEMFEWSVSSENLLVVL